MKSYAYELLKVFPKLKPTEMSYYVWLLYKLDLLEVPEIKSVLNEGLLASLDRLGGPNRALGVGIPMLLNKVMLSHTVVKWMRFLIDEGLPMDQGVDYGNAAGPDGEEITPELVATNVTQMMIAERVIRFDYGNQIPFDPVVDKVLTKVRDMKLEISETGSDNLYELPFVFEPLLTELRNLDVPVGPALVGPFYLRVCQPSQKVVVEWDRNWEMYPESKSRYIMKDYALRKQRYLALEGWTVLKIPLEPFLNSSAMGRRALVSDFCDTHGLFI